MKHGKCTYNNYTKNSLAKQFNLRKMLCLGLYLFNLGVVKRHQIFNCNFMTSASIPHQIFVNSLATNGGLHD